MPRSKGAGRPFVITDNHELILRRCGENPYAVRLLASEILDCHEDTARKAVNALERRGLLDRERDSRRLVFRTTEKGMDVVAERDANEGAGT